MKILGIAVGISLFIFIAQKVGWISSENPLG